MSKKPEEAPPPDTKLLQSEVESLRGALKASEAQLQQAHQTIAAMQITIRVQARTLPQ